MLRAAGRLVSTSMRRPSRLNSSMTLKVLKRRPDYSASDMKSQLQPWLGCAAACSGLLMRAGSRFFPRRGKVQPQLAVHAPQHRLASGLALVAGVVVQQAEAVAWLECHVRLDEGDGPGVVACRRPVTQRGACNSARLAGSQLAHAVIGHKSLNDHLATLRGQSFRSTTSLSAWCISARSAYMRLSLASSSCNWRS